MTRKQFINKMIECNDRVYMMNSGKHLPGEIRKFYRDLRLKKVKAGSYAEAWELFKPVRNCVGM